MAGLAGAHDLAQRSHRLFKGRRVIVAMALVDAWYSLNPVNAQCVPMQQMVLDPTPFPFVAAMREAGGTINKVITQHPSNGVTVVGMLGQSGDDNAPEQGGVFTTSMSQCQPLLQEEIQDGAIADPSKTN